MKARWTAAVRASIVIGSMTAARCGSSAPADAGVVTSSCDQRSSNGGMMYHSCIEVPIPPSEADASAAMCNAHIQGGDGGTASMQTFSLGPCDRTGAVGGCVTGAGTMWFYPFGGFTAADYQMQCQALGGRFISP